MNFYTKKSRSYRGSSAKPGQNLFKFRLQEDKKPLVKLGQKILIGALILIFLILGFNIFQSEIRNYFYFITSGTSDIALKSGSTISNFFGSFS